MTPKTTLNLKVVHVVKIFPNLYNKDANKFVEQVSQENVTKENLNVYIYLATISMVAEVNKSTKHEPMLILSYRENGKRPFKKSSAI